ncbi:MAG: N-acetylmuramic acid 6-phosphate etherase [Candidatus Bathyarchaeia archaeon]
MVRITEERNPNSIGIDEVTVEEVLRIINAEDRWVPTAVAGQLSSIADAVEALAATLSVGGRVFFVGAGTSGRMGVIEAAEMPPTFGVPLGSFQAVMAGGQDAVFRSVEEAEDDESAAERALRKSMFSEGDILVALSASGRTPFVISALKVARDLGSKTVTITCNPEAPANRLTDIPIVVDVGPEVVAGSTRMKAGTAQKLVLNMLTTAAMIKLGRVYDGYMVGVKPTSRKLRERATRTVCSITGMRPEEAAEALDHVGGDVKVAVLMAKTDSNPNESRRVLEQAGGSLRRALDMMEGIR